MQAIIHPTAIVQEGAVLKEGVQIGPFCLIDAEVEIGENTVLQSHVVVKNKTKIGQNNIIYPFASLGQFPQDLKYEGEPTTLTIGDGNTIRESVTMNIGTSGGGGQTVVGNHNLFMALSHVGHDTYIGDHNVFANGATLAGHVEIGHNNVLGGLSAVHQFTRLGDHVMVGGMTAVDRDVISYGVVSGGRGVLSGLNLRGLKRRGFDKARIAKIREYYSLIFEEREGNLEDRMQALWFENQNCEDLTLWRDFIKNSSRGMSMPLRL
jgi:UDP-N-acetylglucosamine acyltransferase